MKAWLAVLMVLAMLALPAAAAAQEGGPAPSPDEVNRIAKNLYCPVCANVPLDACNTTACILWRDQIADLLSEGYSEQQIYDYFVAQYGPGVLAAPPPSGFNWLIYILPPLALAGGGVLVWRSLAAARKQAKPAKAKRAKASKYTEQLEDELKARR
jgi:cytochrome c-type biogenesis protein CcmH